MKPVYSLLFPLLLVACDHPEQVVSTSTTNVPQAVTYNYDHLEGTYQGLFDGTDIRIVLRHVNGRHAVGYDLHRGLRRNISGTMQPGPEGFSFTLSEPGDNPYDGVFRFRIDTSTFTLTGNWEPAASQRLTAKNFVLKRVPADTGSIDYPDATSFGDSIGDFHFYPNGLCKYLYYPASGGQQEEVKGNWSLQQETYTVSWAPNPVFKGASHFTRKYAKDTDGTVSGYVEALEGEGRTLYSIELP